MNNMKSNKMTVVKLKRLHGAHGGESNRLHGGESNRLHGGSEMCMRNGETK